jgi:tetratricopeptide (TPR) repeat protein
VNITYSKKKQEMRHDPVMESIMGAREWLVKNRTVVTSATFGVLFVAIIAMVLFSVRTASMQKAQEAFGRAMVAYVDRDEAKAVELLTSVADNNKHTPQAAYSAYLLGSLYLAQDKYDEAIEWLQSVASRHDAGFVPGEALEALGMAYEGKGDLQNAVKYYGKALGDDRVAYRQDAVRWKLALIKQQQKEYGEATALCQKILADTLAADLHPKAEQLIAEIRYAGKS